MIDNIPEFQILRKQMNNQGISDDVIFCYIDECLEINWKYGSVYKIIDLEELKRLCNYGKV